jgi:hypothetical protein
MATFWICNLEANNFIFESITFERLRDDDRKRRSWADKHNITFTAVADDDSKVQPIVRPDGLLGVINEICLLLSLAQSRLIYCPFYEIKGVSTRRSVSGRGKSTGDKLVRENELQPFLATAVQILRKPGWAEESGFLPSVIFLLEAKSVRLVDVAFMLDWIALEILTNARAKKKHISMQILPPEQFEEVTKLIHGFLDDAMKQGTLQEEQKEAIKKKLSDLNRYPIRQAVKRLRLCDAPLWDFMKDTLIDDCNSLRNGILHSGTYRGLDKRKVVDLHLKLSRSLQLMLIHLLGCSQFVEG